MTDKCNTESTSPNGKKDDAGFSYSFFINVGVKSFLTSLAITIMSGPLNLLAGYAITKREFLFIPFVKNLGTMLPASAASGQVRVAMTHVTKSASSVSEKKHAEARDDYTEGRWLQKCAYNLINNKFAQTGVFSQALLLGGGYWDNLADLRAQQIKLKQPFANFHRVLGAGYPIISASRFINLYFAAQSSDLVDEMIPKNLFSDCPTGRNILGGVAVGACMAVINYPLSVSHYLLLGQAKVFDEKIHFPSSVAFFKSAIKQAKEAGLANSTKDFLSTAIKVLPMKSLNSVMLIVTLNIMDDLLGDTPADAFVTKCMPGKK